MEENELTPPWERISKTVMEQYEIVRSSGLTNMFDYYRVQDIADQLELYELAELDRKEYLYILKNFSDLMSHYEITQTR